MEWQPIETAPNRGQVILYHPPVRRERPPHDIVLGAHVRVGYPGEWSHRPATHWMPLPEPPKGA